MRWMWMREIHSQKYFSSNPLKRFLSTRRTVRFCTAQIRELSLTPDSTVVMLQKDKRPSRLAVSRLFVAYKICMSHEFLALNCVNSIASLVFCGLDLVNKKRYRRILVLVPYFWLSHMIKLCDFTQIAWMSLGLTAQIFRKKLLCVPSGHMPDTLMCWLSFH